MLAFIYNLSIYWFNELFAPMIGGLPGHVPYIAPQSDYYTLWQLAQGNNMFTPLPVPNSPFFIAYHTYCMARASVKYTFYAYLSFCFSWAALVTFLMNLDTLVIPTIPFVYFKSLIIAPSVPCDALFGTAFHNVLFDFLFPRPPSGPVQPPYPFRYMVFLGPPTDKYH